MGWFFCSIIIVPSNTRSFSLLVGLELSSAHLLLERVLPWSTHTHTHTCIHTHTIVNYNPCFLTADDRKKSPPQVAPKFHVSRLETGQKGNAGVHPVYVCAFVRVCVCVCVCVCVLGCTCKIAPPPPPPFSSIQKTLIIPQRAILLWSWSLSDN